MQSAPEDTDTIAWSRYFAVETNNRAWDLATRSSRSEADSQEMLHTAHASAYHWGIVGTDQQRARATYLVALVHALLGHGASALTLVEAARAHFDMEQPPDWERALLHAVHAHAAAAAGDAPSHEASFAAAEAGLRAIADLDDRRVVEDVFRHVPKPKG